MKLNNLIRVPNSEQGILHAINSDLRRTKYFYRTHALRLPQLKPAGGGGRGEASSQFPITFDALVTGMDPCAHRADHWVALSLCLSVCPSTFLKPCEDLVNIVNVVKT